MEGVIRHRKLTRSELLCRRIREVVIMSEIELVLNIIKNKYNDAITLQQLDELLEELNFEVVDDPNPKKS
jgi:hypothetical protein